MTLNTTFLLMAQYNGKAIVPLADVCRDYFSHLAPEKLLRKVMAGQIPLPVVHIEHSQKAPRVSTYRIWLTISISDEPRPQKSVPSFMAPADNQFRSIISGVAFGLDCVEKRGLEVMLMN